MVEKCTLPDGTPGTMTYYECGDDTPPDAPCVASPPEQYNGEMDASYLIMTVVYAPPGSKACVKSTVSYGSGGSVGTSVSTSSSFKGSQSIGVELSGGVFGTGASAGVSFGWENQQQDASEMSVTKTESSSLTVEGPCTVDGIDHDQDQIWLVLGPHVTARAVEYGNDPLNPRNKLYWSLSDSGAPQFVRVGELKGTMPFRSGVEAQLAEVGITTADYETILSADPLAYAERDSTEVPDTNRFKKVYSFPYNPDDGGSTAGGHYDMAREVKSSDSSESTHSYAVSMKLTGEAGFITFAKAKLTAAESLTWTSSNKQSEFSASTTKASVDIGRASADYPASTLDVYYDTIYRTYAFVRASP